MIHDVLAWSFLLPLVTLLLSASGLPGRAGALSWLSPAVIFGLALACLLAGDLHGNDVVVAGWVPFLPDTAFRLHVDALADVMLLVVGGVSTCVYVYSLGYMKDDERPHRFFAFLDFFVASMVLLVVAGNLGVLLIGWTGVGVASFLLISFWWQRGEPLQAGFLALGANAIGDAALLVAVVLIPKGAGNLAGLGGMDMSSVPGGGATIAWCLVIAACAKSAQGPLWWWLPSAMAGPTPVSALIHAATMVAAGVYLLVRTSGLLMHSDVVMWNITLIGLCTAIGGGVASLWQTNFKRGLAYSTVSQLGWMFTAIGVGAPLAALFHLITHASFKAMLFLSAGTVIAATHHEEDIRKMGGLRKKLPMAHAYFVLGTLSLIGAPFITAGAFSKDAMLQGALSSQWPFIGWILLVSTVITGAYAGRLLFGAFYGPEGEAVKHAHAPGALFDWPLLPLAAGAVALGWVQAQTHALSRLLGGEIDADLPHDGMAWGVMAGAFAAGLVGVGIGALIARTRTKCLPAPPQALTGALLGELKAMPDSFASIHDGRVGRYALIGLVGTALIVYLAQRPPSVAPAGDRAAVGMKAPERERPQKKKPRAIDPRQAKAKAIERLQNMLHARTPAELKRRLEQQRKHAEEHGKDPSKLDAGGNPRRGPGKLVPVQPKKPGGDQGRTP